MQNKIMMKYPSAWHGDMWREAAPCGNGVIGASIYGGVKKEIILLNHESLWYGSKTVELPDVSDSLPKIRKKLLDNLPAEADKIFSESLRERKYDGELSWPLPLGDITIFSKSNQAFFHYRREIDMSKALVTVSWEEGDAVYSRSTFVSRSNNLVFTRIRCSKPILDVSIGLSRHEPETAGAYEFKHEENVVKSNYIYFAAYNQSEYHGGDYGGLCKVITKGAVTSGYFIDEQVKNPVLDVCQTDEILIVTKLFVSCDRKDAFRETLEDYDFDQELKTHAAIHCNLYGRVEFSISQGHRSNEELLLEAFDSGASNELIEKLYAYGRYLFICATSDKDTLPCHLLGLWNGAYQSMWAFYMYNVNYEMIYWQALTGNLPEFLKLALNYTESQIEDFRENAKKMFGCRGIYINSVNTPESGLSKCMGNHLLNWTAAAAWFSQHFWDYCEYTNDMEYMKNHAMPFMYEAALFYEDFLTIGEDGYYVFSPSVSPENTAGNVMQHAGLKGIETSVNATMDIAVVRELLTNLLKGVEITGMYQEKKKLWEQMLKKLPPYQINGDGAIKEWTHDFYMDNYNHRHHSHLYPLFPGKEITKDSPLFPAFERAEDMRLEYGLSDQSSWSMIFMTGLAARMGHGDRALMLLDTMARTCLMNNLFTVHNDWRRMGPVYCNDFRNAPFQIDGNIGIPAVIHEMLLFSTMETIEILPALPEKWERGFIKGLLAVGGIVCDIHWDVTGVSVKLQSDRPMVRKVVFRNMERELTISDECLITMERK